jgi:hypothetical protein
MDVSQIQKFLAESVQQRRNWRRIRILGGEPFLHEDLERIVDLLVEYKDNTNPSVVIEIVTNGFGTGLEIRRAAMATRVSVVNTHKQSPSGNKFDEFNMAPRDEWRFAFANYANACWIPSECGIGLTPFGYYHCAIAGGIDRVLGLGIGLKGLPLPGEPFTRLEQKLCPWCGHFRVGSHQSSKAKEPLDAQHYSRSWERVYREHTASSEKLERY